MSFRLGPWAAGLARMPVLTLALGLLVPACGPERVQAPAPATLRAVVLVTVDGIVAEKLSLYGGALETPHLQALARDGRAWRDAWTSCPMTRPAVATYLTGLAPDRHGVRDDLFTALDETVPTLATLLSAQGFETAAFPDSSFLGSGSGLLRGFAIVDDPPTASISPARFIPELSADQDPAKSFGIWVKGVAPESRYFAWLHFSWPLAQQMNQRFVESRVREAQEAGRTGAEPEPQDVASADPDADDVPPLAGAATDRPDAVQAFDEALGRVLEAVDAAGDRRRALVVVAGTQGDATGGQDDLGGPGYSLAETAVRVPLVARWPEGAAPPGRAEDQPVRAEDVAAMVAGLAAVTLSPDAEGIDLAEPAAADRIRFAWSWAPLDQMGWKALRAARSGTVTRHEGHQTRTLDASGGDPAAQEGRLIEALGHRREPSAAAVPLEVVLPLLQAEGMTPRPAPPGGRDFGTAATRREVGNLVWRARFLMRYRYGARAGKRFEKALGLDPDNPGVRLDRGQVLALVGRLDQALAMLGPALELYPGNPELLHWYAHAIWTRRPDQVETLIKAILPYRSQDGDVLYDLACVKSLAGDLDGAEQYLRASIEAGYREWPHMEGDTDLRKLRESGRFAAVLREYRH